jgi:hypothetical protein
MNSGFYLEQSCRNSCDTRSVHEGRRAGEDCVMVAIVLQTQPINRPYFHEPKPEEKPRKLKTKSFARILEKALKNPPSRLPGRLMM